MLICIGLAHSLWYNLGMKLRLASALFISILLIGGAGWVRASQSSSNSEKLVQDLVSLSKKETENTNTTPSLNSDPSNILSSATQNKNLNSTDLISHQLILDYVDLAEGGGATEENINALAQKYVESLPTLDKASIASYGDLNPVSNSPQNLRDYSASLTRIQEAYRNKIIKEAASIKNLKILGGDTYALMRTYGNLYKETAEKLKLLPVPALLAAEHLKLINNYLSSSSATIAISNTDRDSAFAFVGLVTYSKNLDEEEIILENISTLLSQNGI